MDQFAHPMRPQSQPLSASAGAGKPPAGPPPPKPHHNGVADVKPRLTKDQHDILEAHFRQQHKPSTSVKKGFAETLGVPLDKINNWFQNRRAKVKQDIKKQINQYNQSMGIYGPPQLPVVNSQFPPPADQPASQPQPPPMHQDRYAPTPVTADVSPTCMPIQTMEGPSSLELGPQMPLHHGYDMHALRSIPEADRTAYHPNAVMQSFLAATAGASSYMQNHAASLPQQDAAFTYDHSGLPSSFSTDLGFSMPHSLPSEPVPSHDTFSHFDFSNLDYAGLANTTSASSADVQNGNGSVSSEPSPFSGAQSNATTQSSSGPNASSVTSIASVYSGWTEDQNGDAKLGAANECEDSFDAPYGLPQASVSDHTLAFWGPNGQGQQAFSHADMYQHANASANAVLSSPEQTEDGHLSIGPTDFGTPPTVGDDSFSRRNSSTTNLASNMEAINIQNTHTPDGFKQPNPPSSIAARRQKRPTALNSSTLRSASYSGSMPSPGGSGDQTLRRIRSTGIGNTGRVQKSTPGSAQRSPLTMTFAEAAASPKFARNFSSATTTTAGQSGTLAPPTPQTPSGVPLLSYWQGNVANKSHSSMPEHSSPESLTVNWSVEQQSAGLYASGTSPPSTPLDLYQLNQARLATDLYRDTPPQSAPATQQTFPRTAFRQTQQMRPGFHSSTDLSTIAAPKPNHWRRPSLPDPGHGPLDDPHMQFPMLFGDNYGDMSLHGINHNVPFAPPAVMPEFLVHQYNPPPGSNGPATMMRRPTEPQQKSYIFANQGPGDFRS